MKNSIELVGKVEGFVGTLSQLDIDSEFLDQYGETVVISRKDLDLFEGSDGYLYDCKGFAWGMEKVVNILVKRK